MYSFESRVRYSECDKSGRLSIVGLIDYLQDCTTFHCDHVGHGLEFMAEHDYAWFIAAWQIHILRLPRFTEKIRVSTNAYDMGSVTSNRNFSITDEKGEPCVLADSIWFTYDTAAKSPCRIPEFERVYVTGEPKLDLPRTSRKIKVPAGGVELPGFHVVEQMLDTNNHVNNAQYVSIADGIVRARDPRFQTRVIRVQYRSMALLGDVVCPHLHRTEGGYIVDLADESGSSYAIVSFESGSGEARTPAVPRPAADDAGREA